MELSKFVENHCTGKQYDSCVESPCAFASHSGCRHPLHPNNSRPTKDAADMAIAPVAEEEARYLAMMELDIRSNSATPLI